jgi:hypothetical protein
VRKRQTQRRAREEASRQRDEAGERIDEAVRVRSAQSERAVADKLEEWKRKHAGTSESDG